MMSGAEGGCASLWHPGVSAVTVTAAAALVERGDELSRIEALLDSAEAGAGRVLCFDGEAGIGKSALLAACVELAAARGMRSLRARGGELERDFGFGIVRQLFEPALVGAPDARRNELLEGAAEPAAAAIGLAPSATLEDSSASFAAQHALYWLTANLSAAAPLLICVDDAQWADPESLRWLLYLGRRLDELAVGVVLATRTGEPGASDPALANLRSEALTSVISPIPLSPDGSARLLAPFFGTTPAPEFADACHAACGGNPFLLSELAGSISADGIEPRAEATSLIEGMSGGRVSDRILLRLTRLGPDAIALARAVAVLGSGADRRRAALLAQLDGERAGGAADALSDARVLTRGSSLEFVHPLVATEIYDDIPTSARGSLHLAAARLLDAEGASDEAAIHLLEAPREGAPWIVDRLLELGIRDRSRGAVDSAVRLLRRALAEPPGPEQRAQVLIELGRSERVVGAPEATARLRQARAIAETPAQIEEATHELAYVLGVTGEIDAGSAVLEEAIEELAPVDREAALRLEVDLHSLLINHDAGASRGAERLARVLPSVPVDTPTERALLALDTWVRFESGRGTAAEMEEIAIRALDGIGLVEELGPDALPVQAGITGLQRADRFDLADPLVDRILADCRRRGSLSGAATALVLRAHGAWLKGEMHTLEAEGEAAVEASTLIGFPFYFYAGLTLLADALVESGRLDAADEKLRTYGLAEGDPPRYVLGRMILVVRSRLYSERGEHERAVADGLEALTRDRARFGTGLAYPSLYYTARALLEAGERERATELADEFVERAERWGLPSELGIALRLRGCCEGGDAGIELLRRACQLLEPTPRRFEYAEALIEFGAALRRAGQREASREPLRAGMELAHRLGAGLAAQRALEELRASGARPRSLVRSGVDSLTPSERRVARLASEGRSNPEIAQALFLSRRTVEAHLRGVFRKLEIARREELSPILAAE